MRLWTVHPQYLDTPGLTAVWREALLAQAVLRGDTKGYKTHPQLIRFRDQADPLAAIGAFLLGIHEEASARGYRFDLTRVDALQASARIEETDGQLLGEWRHLLSKLRSRAPELYSEFNVIDTPDAHPVFSIVKGPIRAWERSAR